MTRYGWVKQTLTPMHNQVTMTLFSLTKKKKKPWN